MSEPDDPSIEQILSAGDVAAVRAAAAALVEQEGKGVPRRSLLALASRGMTMSVLRPETAGDPVVAIVRSENLEAHDLFALLTAREHEVAALVAHGHPNKHIAAILGISVATVKDHVHRILSKTGLPTRAAVAARWQRR